MQAERYCDACMKMQPFDSEWKALWIDADGDLRMTDADREGTTAYERAGTVMACGQGSALVLVERFLHTRGFNPSIALNHSTSGQTGRELTVYLT